MAREFEYSDFGKIYVKDGNNLVEIENCKGNIFGSERFFTGREWDSESGLYYYRARYYDAELGRFISRDPIDVEDQINLYGYVGNNPVMYVDPMGLKQYLIMALKGHEDYIQYGADYQEQQLVESGVKKEDIHRVNISNFDDFSNALGCFKKLLIKSKESGEIQYIGHNEKFLKPEIINNKKFNQLESFKDEKGNQLDVNITLMACNSAVGGTNSSAIKIGIQLKPTSVVGYKSYVFFSGGDVPLGYFMPKGKNFTFGGKEKFYILSR